MIPVWLLRRLPAVLLLAVLGGGVWLVSDAFRDRAHQRVELQAVRKELAVMHAELARAEEAARVHREHLKRTADDARRFQTITNDLQTMEGRDAPLSPLLAATADRLFGARD